MFSNLTSYIFGGNSDATSEATASHNEGSVSPPLIISSSSAANATVATAVQQPQPHLQRQEPPAKPAVSTAPSDESRSDEEDWVLVGGGVGRAPTLGSLNDVVPRPLTGSTGSSAPPSEDGMDGDGEMPDQDRQEPQPPVAGPPAVNRASSGRRLTPISAGGGAGCLAARQIGLARGAQAAQAKRTFPQPPRHCQGTGEEKQGCEE